MTEPRPVYVKWVDSTAEMGWFGLGKLKGMCLECVTLGFLVYEDDDLITISSSISYAEGGKPNSVSDPMSIPRVAIRDMWYIDGVH